MYPLFRSHRISFKECISQVDSAVLKAANQNVKYCYERALQAEERAARARNSEERRFYLDCEARWLTLAASYDYQECLTAFLRELRGFVKSPLCSACGLPMRPKRLIQCGKGLYEFQFECVPCEVTKTVSEINAKDGQS